MTAMARVSVKRSSQTSGLLERRPQRDWSVRMKRVARTWRETRKGTAEAGLRPDEAPLEGIPGECGAPDAVRGLNYALERHQLSHLWVLFRPHHLKKGFY
jgi:hypothetical protein